MSFNLTDVGNANRFISQHRESVRHCREWRSWLIWDGRRWARDRTGTVVQLAEQTVRTIYKEAADALDDEERKAIAKWARTSESEQRIRAMLKLAESDPAVATVPEIFDADPWLLNVLNGTVDLRAGELRENRREDLLTKLAPVEYDPEVRLGLWDSFLERILPNPDVRAFIQRATGYSLTGLTSEEKLFFAYGQTATGKSTFLAAMGAAMGDYAATADFETFLEQPGGSGTRNDIARLAGRRFVSSIEMNDGCRLAEGLVKMLTGGDVVAARFLYQEYFEFVPQFKLWLSANHRPKVRGDDDAIWRRIIQIPFVQQIPEADQDPGVKAVLRDPARAGPAILAWAVKGCIEWQRRGLDVPDAVKGATEEYRQEMDPLADFLEECCLINPLAKVKNSDLFRGYETWARDNGEKYTLGRKQFTQELMRRGFTQERGHGGRFWQGISLVA